MQRIHWKASARTSQLMVKDYSMPIGSGALVLFDLRVAEDAGMVFLDQAVEYGLAILQGFWIRSIRRGRRGITAGHRVWNRWRSGSRKICIC